MSSFFDRKSAARVRARSQRQRNLSAGLSLMLLLAAAAATGLGAKHYGLYKIRSIQVQGCRAVSREDVTATMKAAVGRPMWRSGRQGLAKMAQQRQPGIKGIGTRIWPWGTLAVLITERRGVARIDGSNTWCIDDEGMIFEDRTGVPSELPSLRLAGSTEAGRRRALTAILEAGIAEPSWIFDSDDEGNITVQVTPQMQAELGNGQFADKWRRLREILNSCSQADGQPCTIDLRFWKQGIVKKQT